MSRRNIDLPGPLAWLENWAGSITAFLLLAAFVSLPGLGSAGLMNMEAMVALSAETMLQSGDFVVPRLYGEVYTYKPPLAYWFAAAGLATGMAPEWALRLPGVLTAALMGLTVLLFAGKLTTPGTGFVSGAASISGLLFLQKVRWAEYDTLLAALSGIAIMTACYQLSVDRSRRSLPLWGLCYAALTAAVMVKGVPALMVFAPGLLAAAVVTGRIRALFRWDHLAATAAFILIIGAYLWLLWQAVGSVAFAQPLAEAEKRGFEWTLGAILLSALKPAIIFAVFLPWSALWAAGLSNLRRTARDSPRGRLVWAAAAFLVIGIAIFVAVPTHENRYYLPLCVPGALVSALALERLGPLSVRARRWAIGSTLACGALVTLASTLTEFETGSRVALAGIGLAILGSTWLVARRAGRSLVAGLMLVTVLGASAAETLAFRPRRALKRDFRSVAEALDKELEQEDSIWALADHSLRGDFAPLHFYLGREVRTFAAGVEFPPTDAATVLAASELDILTGIDPAAPRRLRLVRTVDHPSQAFHLFLVGEPGDGTAAREWSER